MDKKLYFDANATARIRPEVISLVVEVMGEVGNASSPHSFGREARKRIETARRQVAATLNVDAQQVIFNSGATEGNTTVFKGFEGKRILASAIEHPSIMDCGVALETIPVTSDGVVDLDAFKKMLSSGPSPALVSVMTANNETGVIQPVAEIAKLAKDAGAMVHSDAVQGYGRFAFTRESLGVDFLTLSAHKIGGPQGVGAMVIAPGVTPYKLLQGGGQERRQRGGTENVAGIAGFGLAAEMACSSFEKFQSLGALRDRIEVHFQTSPRVTVYGANVPRTANTSFMTIKGVPNDTLLMAFDLEGVAVSAGSACSSGSTRLSNVLGAMGVVSDPLLASLRISLGINTTEKEVEELCAIWDKLRAR
ncbi:MAG TPA: cysteine desulfurase family protein, partial [Alphaproteobacteria bacterium]|nr:cysteine desulfurase family protein [Alphaproteobacteria bacterium]